MRRFFCCALVALIAGLTVSCEGEGDTYLDGSLTKSYPMGFDDVRVRLFPGELAIQYLQADKIPLGVTLDTVQYESLAAGQSYSIKNFSRVVGPGSTLPAMDEGELKLAEYGGEDGSPVKGTFSASFTSANGNRLTLRGGFVADLEIVVLK